MIASKLRQGDEIRVVAPSRSLIEPLRVRSEYTSAKSAPVDTAIARISSSNLFSIIAIYLSDLIY